MRFSNSWVAFAALAFAVGLAQPAEARKARHIKSKQVASVSDAASYTYDNNGRVVYSGAANPGIVYDETGSAHRGGAVGRLIAMLPHPPGCPRTRFCGCGASWKVYGRAVARGGFAIASNWLKLPATAPAPGMVAARPGHVFVLVSHESGSNWIVDDFNSGGHQSRRWVRNIAGYKIVNPHGVRVASME